MKLRRNVCHMFACKKNPHQNIWSRIVKQNFLPSYIDWNLGVFTTRLHLPVGGFKLCAQKSIAKIESDVVFSRCFFWDLWQTENHPGVDLCKTELPHQAKTVHGSEEDKQKTRQKVTAWQQHWLTLLRSALRFEHSPELLYGGSNIDGYDYWPEKPLHKLEFTRHTLIGLFLLRNSHHRQTVSHLAGSMLWVRWWRDRGLIWYWRTWQVLGCSLGVM